MGLKKLDQITEDLEKVLHDEIAVRSPQYVGSPITFSRPAQKADEERVRAETERRKAEAERIKQGEERGKAEAARVQARARERDEGAHSLMLYSTALANLRVLQKYQGFSTSFPPPPKPLMDLRNSGRTVSVSPEHE